jgi:hypothetical protein
MGIQPGSRLGSHENAARSGTMSQRDGKELYRFGNSLFARAVLGVNPLYHVAPDWAPTPH